MVDSDARLDPQAYILAPVNCIAAKAIVQAPDCYRARKIAAHIGPYGQGMASGSVQISEREVPWFDTIQFVERLMGTIETTKFLPAEYDLSM